MTRTQTPQKKPLTVLKQRKNVVAGLYQEEGSVVAAEVRIGEDQDLAMRNAVRRNAVVKMKNAGAEIELKENVKENVKERERYNGRGEGERRGKENREESGKELVKERRKKWPQNSARKRRK